MKKNRVFKVIFKNNLFAKIVYNCNIDAEDIGFINVNFIEDEDSDFIHFYYSIEKNKLTFNFLEEHDAEIEILDVKIKKNQKWVSIDSPQANF